jgi:hypothetical protein
MVVIQLEQLEIVLANVQWVILEIIVNSQMHVLVEKMEQNVRILVRQLESRECVGACVYLDSPETIVKFQVLAFKLITLPNAKMEEFLLV